MRYTKRGEMSSTEGKYNGTESILNFWFDPSRCIPTIPHVHTLAVSTAGLHGVILEAVTSGYSICPIS